jgi:hypothetical protein
MPCAVHSMVEWAFGGLLSRLALSMTAMCLLLQSRFALVGWINAQLCCHSVQDCNVCCCKVPHVVRGVCSCVGLVAVTGWSMHARLCCSTWLLVVVGSTVPVMEA